MRLERMSETDALQAAKTLPWAYIIGLSQVYLGPVPAEMDTDEWLEARFFGSEKEVHFLHGDEGLDITCLTEEPGDHTIDFTASVALAGHDNKYLLARKYLTVDEDGQSYIAAVRLVAEEGHP